MSQPASFERLQSPEKDNTVKPLTDPSQNFKNIEPMSHDIIGRILVNAEMLHWPVIQPHFRVLTSVTSKPRHPRNKNSSSNRFTAIVITATPGESHFRILHKGPIKPYRAEALHSLLLELEREVARTLEGKEQGQYVAFPARDFGNTMAADAAVPGKAGEVMPGIAPTWTDGSGAVRNEGQVAEVEGSFDHFRRLTEEIWHGRPPVARGGGGGGGVQAVPYGVANAPVMYQHGFDGTGMGMQHYGAPQQYGAPQHYGPPQQSPLPAPFPICNPVRRVSTDHIYRTAHNITRRAQKQRPVLVNGWIAPPTNNLNNGVQGPFDDYYYNNGNDRPSFGHQAAFCHQPAFRHAEEGEGSFVESAAEMKWGGQQGKIDIRIPVLHNGRSRGQSGSI